MLTTRLSPKPFTWSYSKMKNFESCPKRHFEIDIAKNIKEDDSEQLMWGNEVHAKMAERIEKGTPLPKSMEKFEKWAVESLPTDKYPNDRILVEQKLAITREFAPCGFFDNDVWFRCVVDLLKISEPVALMRDWKTGKIVEDSQQLALAAACVFAAHPEVHAMRTEFIWLKEDAVSRKDFKRTEMPEMWKNIWDRYETMENAHKNTEYPAKPGYLCKRWCPVTACAHHGD